MNELYMLTSPKLGCSRPVVRVAAFAAVAALVGACATTPSDPVSEKLDPDTATTITTLSRPIELFSQHTRGTANDPFAYIAPFETDRQGQRALYLWVSAPQVQGALTLPQVLCNGQPLTLEPLTDEGPAVPTDNATATAGTPAVRIDWSQLNLSRAPYEPPVPWSAQWYFRLPQDGLKCLANADGISVETRAPDGDAEKFTADRKNLGSLDAFTRH